MGHTARRLRRLRDPLTATLESAERKRGEAPPAAARDRNEQVVAKNRLHWHAPHAKMIATPRGSRRSRSAAVTAARERVAHQYGA